MSGISSRNEEVLRFTFCRMFPDKLGGLSFQALAEENAGNASGFAMQPDDNRQHRR